MRFSPNRAKTRVLPPGAKKIVLGLLVDLDEPRLPREFKASLRQHVYYPTHQSVGPVKHAVRRCFVSGLELQHSIEGLLHLPGTSTPHLGNGVPKT